MSPTKAKKKKATYVPVNETTPPEVQNRYHEIVAQYEMSLRRSSPLPTEWLADSLNAGEVLPLEDYEL